MKRYFTELTSILLVLGMILLPLLSFAQTSKVCPEEEITVTDIGGVLCKIGFLIKLVIPVLILLGVAYFIWGVVQYVINDSEAAKKKGRDRMIYGLIGFVVIFALWGLVSIVIYTFGIEQPGDVIIRNFVEYNKSFLGSGSEKGCSLPANDPSLGQLLDYATCLITSSVIPLLLALAMAMFLWGVVQYVINDAEEAKKAKGRQFMIWGLIGLTVMVAVWGLVAIIGNTFGIKYAIPQLGR